MRRRWTWAPRLSLCLILAFASGCSGSTSGPSAPEPPRTALEKRAALLELPPTELQKNVAGLAEEVRRMISPYGFELDEDWELSKIAEGDLECHYADFPERLGQLLVRSIKEGDRESRFVLLKLRTALDTCRFGYDSAAAQSARRSMSALLIQLGKPLAAREMFEEDLAQVVAQYGPDSEEAATAIIHRNADLWIAAVFSEAYAFFEEHGALIKRYFPQAYRTTTGSFGVFACFNGRPSLALVYAERLKREYHPSLHAYGFTLSVAQIAACLSQKGNPKDAAQLSQWVQARQGEALDAARSEGPESYAVLSVLSQNAMIHVLWQDHKKAEAAYERLLEKYIPLGIPKLDDPRFGLFVGGRTGLANAQFELGKIKKAESTLAKLAELPQEGYVDVLSPKLLRSLGKYKQALSRLDELDQRTKGWGEHFRLNLLLERARVFAAKGDLKEARDTYQNSLAIGLAHLDVSALGSESERRRAFEKLRPVLDSLVSMNLTKGKSDAAMTEEAFSALLIEKGVLLDALSADHEKLRRSPYKSDVELLKELEATRQSIAQASIQDATDGLFDERLRLEDLESSVRERGRTLGADPKPVTPKLLQAALRPGETLLEFIEFSFEKPENPLQPQVRRTAAYVVKNTGPIRVFDLGPSEKLARAVEEAREKLKSGNQSAQAQLKKLGEIVFGPLEPALQTTRWLRVAPDGALNRIPFAALIDAQGDHYLERFFITYIGTSREWARLANERRESHGAKRLPADRTAAKTPFKSLRPVIIANPEFGNRASGKSPSTGTSPFSLATRGARSAAPLPQNWEPLKGTSKEAKHLAALFPKGRVLTRHNATESAVKEVAGPDILHVASHGYFLPNASSGAPIEMFEDPLLQSGLVLAFANVGGRGADDGFLTALEVAGLDLGGTQVATLSACETGLGQVNGDGVFGLRRALAIAGAQSQLLSLWKVSDQATLEFMTGFYERLEKGQTREQALTSVKRAMAKGQSATLGAKAAPHGNFRHPYYWSAFVLSGEPGALRFSPRSL